MSNFNKLRLSSSPFCTSGFDLAVIILFFTGGAWFLWSPAYWAGLVNMGSAQYGDAAFWWNGALHFAEGIIRDNPNLDYRMGYASLAGLAVAVMGTSFIVFHKLLIVVFLFAASVLYFALKPSLGRIAAAGSVALLIFNPFTAEWLAISTSDSTGLILNLAALSCFIFGVRNSSLHLGFLAAFGILLACASLTRPLMSPFIVSAVLIAVLYRGADWRRRLSGVAAMLGAFAVPTVVWVIVLHSLTGSWAMAGQDSTTFYAASDPYIQVWNGPMYDKVKDSAKNRYQTEKVTADQLNKEFWLWTKNNYASHLNYHVARIVPHTLEISGFSSQQTPKKDPRWERIRAGIVGLTVLGLMIFAALAGRWGRSVLVGLAGFFVAVLPASQSLVTLLPASLVAALPASWLVIASGQSFGTVLPPSWVPVLPASLVQLQSAIPSIFILFCAAFFTFSALRARGDRVHAALATYWWTGAVVLFLVGGTWGPPLGPTHDLNALGYRLGSQFFFVNDVLMLAMLALIAAATKPSQQRLATSAPAAGIDAVQSPPVSAPLTGVSALFPAAATAFVSVLVLGCLAGAGVVGYKSWKRAHDIPVSFPPLKLAEDWWRAKQASSPLTVPLETISKISDLQDHLGNKDTGSPASPYMLFSGGMSAFIWNFDEQKRSQAIVYLQKDVSPVQMSPNLVYVEFPSHLHEAEWVGKQGAWLIRQLPDMPLKSNLPFYFSEPSVKAFIPLTPDGRGYDFSAARTFPLQKYASQLYASGDLKVANGMLEWAYNSGAREYPRRFSLQREPAAASSGPIVLELDISRSVGARTLMFKWAMETASKEVQSLPSSLKVVGRTDEPEGRNKDVQYFRSDLAPDSENPHAAKIDLTQDKGGKVRLILEGLKPGEKIWFYEFNLESDDFLRQR